MKIIKDFRPQGHAYWVDDRHRLVVSDNSGDTPDSTDDGVLYIDRLAGLMIGKRGIALALRGGSSTCVSIEEAAWLNLSQGVFVSFALSSGLVQHIR